MIQCEALVYNIHILLYKYILRLSSRENGVTQVTLSCRRRNIASRVVLDVGFKWKYRGFVRAIVLDTNQSVGTTCTLIYLYVVLFLGGGGAKIIEYSSFHFPKDQLDLKKQCGEVYVYMCRIVLVR